jgi:hypothetical protein
MNPCGVIMDNIQRPYRSLMRCWADDLSAVVPVQWYFVPPTNRYYPWATPFRSRAWEKVQHEGGLVLGEDPQSVHWGPPESVPHGPGKTVCGSRAIWRDGATAATPIPPTNVLTGLPCCCGGGTRVSDMAVALGADDHQVWLAQENLGYVLRENDGGIIIEG